MLSLCCMEHSNCTDNQRIWTSRPITDACAQALAAIHAAGILHGKLSVNNLIFEEGTGKVRAGRSSC